MTIDFQALRLDGIYRMNDRDELMLRIKLAGGTFSADQAGVIAGLADSYAQGRLHATCRGSFELHRLQVADIEPIKAALAAAGMTSRGACGGAVRGVSCSANLQPGGDTAQRLAVELQRHFTGHGKFEGLPKKFKIGIDAGYAGGRYLIQDAGLVYAGGGPESPRWDVWAGGGLGREPQAALPLTRDLPETRLRPLLEALLLVYRAHAPASKRLKLVINSLGPEEFRRQVQQHLGWELGEPPQIQLTPASTTAEPAPVEFRCFAGELTSTDLRRLAALARQHAGGRMSVTGDQNLALPPVDAAAQQCLLQESGAPAGKGVFRICPGSHDCRLGLAPTRDLGRQLLTKLGPAVAGSTLAFSGCPNSCSQPQLADFGIVSTKRLKDEASPWRFVLYRRNGTGLGEAVAHDLTWEEITVHLGKLTKADSHPE